MFSFLRYFVSISLLIYLINNFGINIYALITNIEYKYLILVLIISIFQYSLSAYRWMYISSESGTEMSFSFCLRYYYIASFINNVSPGGVIGDMYRIYYSKDNKHAAIKLGQSLQSVVFERLSGQIMLFLIFIFSLSIYFLTNEKYVAFLYMLAPVSVSLLIVYFSIKFFIMKRGYAKDLSQNFKKIFTGAIFWNHTIISFFVVLSYIVIYIISAETLSISIDYGAFFVFTPIVLFSMTLPVSIGGWGVREATALLISFLLGLSSSASINVAIMYGIFNLICSAPGFYFLLTPRR